MASGRRRPSNAPPHDRPAASRGHPVEAWGRTDSPRAFNLEEGKTVFRNWYRAWVSRNRQLSRRERRRASRERDRARHRPQVESLEDRTLLSNYFPPTYSTPQLGGLLTDPSSADPLSIAQGYLAANAEAFGLTADDVAHVRLTSRTPDKDTGVT